MRTFQSRVIFQVNAHVVVSDPVRIRIWIRDCWAGEAEGSRGGRGWQGRTRRQRTLYTSSSTGATSGDGICPWRPSSVMFDMARYIVSTTGLMAGAGLSEYWTLPSILVYKFVALSRRTWIPAQSGARPRRRVWCQAVLPAIEPMSWISFNTWSRGHDMLLYRDLKFMCNLCALITCRR